MTTTAIAAPNALTTDRCRPSRAGIVNLYQYTDQVFVFEDGRLALRGRNTSGKSKALELLFPFALEGVMKAQRTDPFGKSDKTMLWNLVGHRRSKGPQIGIVWTEFDTPEGWVTCGVHLKAAPSDDKATAHFWLLEGDRIGIDQSLLTDDRRPMTWEQLKDTFAGRLETPPTARDYRARINDLVFGYPTVDQYESYLDLMVQLRQPQLARSLNVEQVMTTLSASLPAVDEAIMRRLGEGLEQLRDMQASRDRMVAAQSTLERFVAGTLRDYARAEVRERSDAFKKAVSEFERISDHLRSAERDQAVMADRAAEIDERVAALRADMSEVEGAREALESSQAWQQIGHLDQLKQAAETAQRAADDAQRVYNDAAAAVSDAETRHSDARGRAAEAQRAFADHTLQLRSACDQAGLSETAAALSADLGDAAQAHITMTALADAASRRLDAIDRHRQITAECDAARRTAEAARRDVQDADDALAAARDRERDLEAAAQDAADQVAAALDIWAQSLQQLRLDGAQVAAVETAALSVGDDDEQSAAETVSALAVPTRDQISGERSSAAADVTSLRAEMHELTEERDRVASESFPAPEQRSSRRADRKGRTGAPLWAVVDWRAEVPADERAAVEVALEESGLLDAWVGAGGEIGGDVAVFADPPAAAGERTLLDVLQPSVGDVHVDAGLVRAVLAAVPFGRRAGGVGVGVGWFDLGPAHGRFDKDDAEFIGAAAREVRRARRIAVLDEQIRDVEQRVGQAQERVDQADQALRELAADLAALPSTRPLRVARSALAVAAAETAAAARHAETQRGRARDAAEEEASCAAAVAAHAEQHALPDADELGDAAQRCQAVTRAASAAESEARRVVDLEHDAAGRFAEIEPARATAEDRQRSLQEARDAAGRHGGAFEAARSTIGVEADDLRARAQQLRDRRADLQRRYDEAQQERFDLGQERANLDALVQRTRSEQRASDEGRQDRLRQFRLLGATGMFGIALGDLAPDDHLSAEEWSYRHALDVARALRDDDLRTRASYETLARGLPQKVHDLAYELRDRDMDAYTDQATGVIVVKVTHGGREQQIDQLIAALDADIERHEAALSSEHARVFSDRLMDDIAEHLRGLIRSVRRRVDGMNQALAACPTGSGRTVSLQWTPADGDGGADLPKLMRLLSGQAMAAMRESEREQLRAFFVHCTDTAKEEQRLEAGRPQSTAAYLMRAFDYRRWFRFDLFERQGADAPVRLTRRRHGTGSGGEQAVLLHMPLFAAASSLASASRDGRAPRLIVLDEALSGIDDTTQRGVLDAAVRLDLDWMMTAYDFNPCQPTVPRVSLYLLHRDNDLYGIGAEWFVWDGTSKVEADGQAAWDLSRT